MVSVIRLFKEFINMESRCDRLGHKLIEYYRSGYFRGGWLYGTVVTKITQQKIICDRCYHVEEDWKKIDDDQYDSFSAPDDMWIEIKKCDKKNPYWYRYWWGKYIQYIKSVIIMGYFLETEFSITCTNVHEYLKVLMKLIIVDFDTESDIKFSYEEKIIKLKVNETKHYMDMLIFLRKYGIMFSEKVIGKRPYPLTE